MSDRTAEDIMRSNECNTYVMSCHLNRDELYNDMRQDISTMCDAYSIIKAQRDELLAALKERNGFYYDRDVPHKSDHPHCQCRKCVLDRVYAAIAHADKDK